MKILVTGAAGFLGTRLIEALLAGRSGLRPAARIVAADLGACRISDPRVEPRVGTITDPGFIESLVAGGADVVYHLAAVLSGQSEAEFDVGLQVNVDATRTLLEACRRLGTAPRFVFASSVAVFGGPLPHVVPEDMALLPQSSYGTEKAIAELLVSDYSRRGFVDGISCRLPTVAIRPGKPNSAMSSFVSGIVREPLAGLESVCPVPPDTRLWITSPAVVTDNLVHAAVLPASALGDRRSVNLPGLSVTPAEMLASLERLGGTEARSRVRTEPDQRMMRIVCTWPGDFDIRRPLDLGFAVDRDVDAIVGQYMTEQGISASSYRPDSASGQLR
jgi:nucleoside-diphosphate-sugar epimerase